MDPPIFLLDNNHDFVVHTKFGWQLWFALRGFLLVPLTVLSQAEWCRRNIQIYCYSRIVAAVVVVAMALCIHTRKSVCKTKLQPENERTQAGAALHQNFTAVTVYSSLSRVYGSPQSKH